MLFLKPDLTKKNRELFFPCLFFQTCYSPPVTSYLTFRPKSNVEGFVWSHQSITGLISQRQFAPKCWFLASRPLGCSSFHLTPYSYHISFLYIPPHLQFISSTTTSPKCTLRNVLLNKKTTTTCMSTFRYPFRVSVAALLCKWYKGCCSWAVLAGISLSAFQQVSALSLWES